MSSKREQAELRIDELSRMLWEHSERYYVNNAPTISDFEYDSLMHELETLEKEFPEFAYADSPTQKVGSDLERQTEFKQYHHKYPMLSLGNTYNIGEIEDFVQRAEKALGDVKFTYSCELKFDGTAICLTYRYGRLVRALTRGDGVIGDDVTANVKQISNVPRVLKGSGWPDVFEIRGEILMPYESFDRLNKEREDNEEPLFANPRNAASGSLKLLDPKEVAKRGLICTLYHIPSQTMAFETHDAALSAAASWGLPISEERKIVSGIDEIEEYIHYWDTERKFLSFPTDGIVIKINEMAYQNELGSTAKSPKWAVAFKFQAEEAITKLLSIDYQVGRTGAVTPVANLEPVQIAGTVVKRATLVNEGQIAQLDIRLGDHVRLVKGGEIIPKIIGVDLSQRTDEHKVPAFPTVCPDCGTKLVKEEDEAKWFCPNTDGCPTQIKGSLLHFVGRKAMNILLGEAAIEQMYNSGLVKTTSDLYSVSLWKLKMLDGWNEKSATLFNDSLTRSREVSFEHVLFALGIRFVGETTAKAIATHFGNIDAIAAASKEDLLAIKDVGEVVANSVWEYFRKPAHLENIERLKSNGLKFQTVEYETLILEGKTIVISGTFSISRDDIERLIETNGGSCGSSISSKTSFLLAGSKPGPEKIKKVGELGIPIMSEEEFLAMLPYSSKKFLNVLQQDSLFPDF